MADNLEPNVVDNSGQTSEESSSSSSWRDNLDPTIREHPSLRDFKTEADLAKSWVEAQKLIGRDKIPVPGEKATKEDWDMVFERLGRPKSPDGYKLPELQIPKGYPETDKEFMENFKSKALELGMLPAQVNGLYEWFMNEQFSQYNQFNEQRGGARGEAENALRRMWGKAYEQNLQAAEQTVNKFGTEGFINKLKASGLNNDPDMIKFISDISKNLSEDRIAGRQIGLTLSPDEALSEISKIQSDALKDPKHVMNNKLDPEYESFMKKWRHLHEMAYPR